MCKIDDIQAAIVRLEGKELDLISQQKDSARENCWDRVAMLADAIATIQSRIEGLAQLLYQELDLQKAKDLQGQG